MRICGRLLRPSTLAERRLLLGHFGTSSIRVRRQFNIFSVARRIERYLKRNDDLAFVRKATVIEPCAPPVSPDLDTPEAPIDADAAAE